jgi:hypothetical protein
MLTHDSTNTCGILFVQSHNLVHATAWGSHIMLALNIQLNASQALWYDSKNPEKSDTQNK